jgi:hypothetical protein
VKRSASGSISTRARRPIGALAKSAASISRGFAFDHGREGHAGQHVAFQVQAGRDLQQFDALLVQTEDAALGDVEHGCPRRQASRPRRCGARPGARISSRRGTEVEPTKTTASRSG